MTKEEKKVEFPVGYPPTKTPGIYWQRCVHRSQVTGVFYVDWVPVTKQGSPLTSGEAVSLPAVDWRDGRLKLDWGGCGPGQQIETLEEAAQEIDDFIQKSYGALAALLREVDRSWGFEPHEEDYA